MEKPKDLTNSLSNYEIDLIKEFVEEKESLSLNVLEGDHIKKVSARISQEGTGHSITVTVNQLDEDTRLIRLERTKKGSNSYKVDTAYTVQELKELLIKNWEEICRDQKK